MDLVSEEFDVALRVGSIADDSVIAPYLMDFRHILVASPSLLNASKPLRESSALVNFLGAA